MGFGKFLCAVGAVIAAPVVLPAAAAAGVAAAAAAGTAAVAAGTAAVAAAGTAATAVGTAATAAGTVVAGSAAGAAVSSGLAAVGSSVGTAAGAVGLSSVAAITGTTAGEISLGAITTSAAVGATSAASGAGKMKEASQMKKEAEEKYNNAKNHFEEIEARTNEKLNDLGRLKLEIWNSFDRFKIAFEQIKNLEGWGDLQIEERVEFGDAELADIKILSLTAKDLMKGGIGSIAGGELVGVALTSGITSVATASTGTAIASLSGAAATNASLAALGGGSLASGGLGMAGGAVVANALVFAPAMAIGGIFLHGKGKKNLNLAKESKQSVYTYKGGKTRAVEKPASRAGNNADGMDGIGTSASEPIAGSGGTTGGISGAENIGGKDSDGTRTPTGKTGTVGNGTRKNGDGISKDRGLNLAQMAELERELKRTGVPLQMVLDRYLLSSLDEMTEANFKGAMNGLLKTKSKSQRVA